MIVIRWLFAVAPLLFGIGFLAPLIAQTLEALSVSAPLGVPPPACGLLVGSLWGAFATLRGRWV